MNRYAAFNAEYRRWVLLRLLSGFPEWRGNDDILQMSLIDAGYEASHEEILEDMNWLAGLGLVELSAAGPFQVATLTRNGGDAVAGRKVVEGLRRPLAGRIAGAGV